MHYELEHSDLKVVWTEKKPLPQHASGMPSPDEVHVGDFCSRKKSVFLSHGSSQYVYNVLGCVLAVMLFHARS